MAARYPSERKKPGGHTLSQIKQRAANIDRVRELLAVKPMTTAELAQIIGVPKATMNGYLYQLQDLGEARSVHGGDNKRRSTWIADAESHLQAKERALKEHASRARVVKAAEAAGQVADSMDVRRALMTRVHAGEITLAEAQQQLKKIQRGAAAKGQTTRAQAYNEG